MKNEAKVCFQIGMKIMIVEDMVKVIEKELIEGQLAIIIEMIAIEIEIKKAIS